MTEKMRAYLDGIFAVVPATEQVKEAKEELFASMVERYNDCLLEGMDEQEAYDAVIESIGDIRELFSELGGGPAPSSGADNSDGYYNTWGEPQAPETEPGSAQGSSFNLNEVIQNVTEFASGLVSGLFSTGDPTAARELVNTRTLALEGISTVDIGYVGETITLYRSDSDQLVLKEYMNRDEAELYARVELRNNSVVIRNGRRSGVFGLRSYVEVYLPESYNGSLVLSTVGGNLKTDEQWKLASLQGRTVSGEVEFAGIEADGMVRLSSTSGSVIVHRGAGQFEMHSISGSIKGENLEGSGSFKTTSGAVRVDFAKLTGNVEATTVSGGVRLMLPAEAAFEFDGRSVSGGIYTAFDGQLTFEKRNKAHGFVGRAPFHHIRAASTSGSIHVND